MADFVAVIRRAVDGLADNTPDYRERVYDKARAAVRRQLENMSPRPSDELIRRQLDKLEAAIGEVELEHSEALPPLEDEPSDDTAFEAPPPEPGEDATETEAVEPVREVIEYEAEPVRRRDGPSPLREAAKPIGRQSTDSEQAEAATPVSSAAAAWGIGEREETERRSYSWRDDDRHEQAGEAESIDPKSLRQPVSEEPFEPAPFAEPALIGEAHDAAFGLGGAQKPKRGFRRGRLVAAVVGLVIVCGAAYGFWENGNALKMMVAKVAPSSSNKPSTASKSSGDEKTASTAPDSGSASPSAASNAKDEASPASKLPDGGKYTQRLMADGSEVNPGPAPAPEQPTPAEGKSVAAKSADSGQAAQQAQPVAAAGQNDTSQQSPAAPKEDSAKAAAEQATVSQKMYLYEERFKDQAPDAISGTVVWSVAKESPGGDAPSEAAIHGEISLPDKGMTALVTIKRNADQSLPASHLIEIVFALPGNFEGGGIESVDRVSMKETEQARGDPLIAVPAKITDNFFMVALNDYSKAVQTNIDLLKSRDWIDIPITYKSGRRALITLEKGASGAKVFDEAMKAWDAAPKPADTSDTGDTGSSDKPSGAPATGSTPPPGQ